MKSSEETKDLAAALAAAQVDFPHLRTDAKNDHFHSQYVTLAALCDTLRPVLAKHGIAAVQGADLADPGTVEVATRLLHSSGQWIESALRMQLDKAGPQAVGAAMTYGQRYLLAAMCCIAADEDDDGEAAERRSPPSPAPRQAPRPDGPDTRPITPAQINMIWARGTAVMSEKELRDVIHAIAGSESSKDVQRHHVDRILEEIKCREMGS